MIAQRRAFYRKVATDLHGWKTDVIRNPSVQIRGLEREPNLRVDATVVRRVPDAKTSESRRRS